MRFIVAKTYGYDLVERIKTFSSKVVVRALPAAVSVELSGNIRRRGIEPGTWPPLLQSTIDKKGNAVLRQGLYVSAVGLKGPKGFTEESPLYFSGALYESLQDPSSPFAYRKKSKDGDNVIIEMGSTLFYVPIHQEGAIFAKGGKVHRIPKRPVIGLGNARLKAFEASVRQFLEWYERW